MFLCKLKEDKNVISNERAKNALVSNKMIKSQKRL